MRISVSFKPQGSKWPLGSTWTQKQNVLLVMSLLNYVMHEHQLPGGQGDAATTRL